MSGRQATFSNYKGNGSNRIPGTFGNVKVTPDVASVGFDQEFVWEHQLELPTEMVGTAFAIFEPDVYFEAAYGMKAVE